jgi:hypothetical protein
MSLRKRGNSAKSGKKFPLRRLSSDLILGLGVVTAVGKAFVAWGPYLEPYAQMLLAVLNNWFL